MGDLFGVCDDDEDGDEVAGGVSGMFSDIFQLSTYGFDLRLGSIILERR